MAALAIPDPALTARVVARRPLRYRRGADPALDRLPVVRAASALAWVGGRLVVVSDDALFLGIVDVATGLVDDVPLPPGPGGARTFDEPRGNKADKLDLEAAFVDGDTLVALGSGGLPPRKQAVVWRPGAAPRVIAIPRLYDAIAAAVLPGETSLNLEGAVVVGDCVVIANRGGDRVDAAVSPDALVRIELRAIRALLADPDGAPVPRCAPVACELGDVGGDRLRFADLAPAAGATLFLAVAERTESFYADGEIVGSVIGVAERITGPDARLRYAQVVGEDGALARDKLEGVATWAGRPDRVLAVSDPDDPDGASTLFELALDGPWFSAAPA